MCYIGYRAQSGISFISKGSAMVGSNCTAILVDRHIFSNLTQNRHFVTKHYCISIVNEAMMGRHLALMSLAAVTVSPSGRLGATEQAGRCLLSRSIPPAPCRSMPPLLPSFVACPTHEKPTPMEAQRRSHRGVLQDLEVVQNDDGSRLRGIHFPVRTFTEIYYII